MLMPLLSAKDPVVSAEGTLDPLGLYQIADALGTKLIPGVRERMSHPRFLTLTAVSAAICSEFDDETIASDGISPPWQVFEWYVVEGLVRCIKDNKRLSGLPGRDKASRAIADRVPLSARRYLKTPNVFGFHGVYRLLARTLDIEDDGRLGEMGYRLLGIWRDEQGLRGFYESVHGQGADLFKTWQDAVKDGLRKGAVDRSGSWQGWQRIADHLGPYDAGAKERRMLASLLVGHEKGFTREVMDFLKSAQGMNVYHKVRERNDTDSVWSERPFHEALRTVASPSLKELLLAIDAYEVFARLLQDAFDECLYILSKSKGRVAALELAERKLVREACDRVPGQFGRITDCLYLFGASSGFIQSFQFVSEKATPKEWVQRLLEHHRRVQIQKPPNGKLPWVERFDDGSYMVRPGYLREEGGIGDDSYVHAYRLSSLWSFAEDLRLV
ncbi:hypothetical protein [Candidatus Nitrospira bockiana]